MKPDRALADDEAALIDEAVNDSTNRILEGLIGRGDINVQPILDAFATMSREDLEFSLHDLKSRIGGAVDSLKIWNLTPGEDDPPGPGTHPTVDLARAVARDLVVAGLPIVTEPHGPQTAGFSVWPVVDDEDEPDEVLIEWQHHPAARLLMPGEDLLQLAVAAKQYVMETLTLLGYIVSVSYGVVSVAGRLR